MTSEKIKEENCSTVSWNWVSGGKDEVQREVWWVLNLEENELESKIMDWTSPNVVLEVVFDSIMSLLGDLALNGVTPVLRLNVESRNKFCAPN